MKRILELSLLLILLLAVGIALRHPANEGPQTAALSSDEYYEIMERIRTATVPAQDRIQVSVEEESDDLLVSPYWLCENLAARYDLLINCPSYALDLEKKYR